MIRSKFPPKSKWKSLSQRPSASSASLESDVRGILERVAQRGDSALLELTEKYDGVSLNTIAISEEEIFDSESKVSAELKGAIQLAKGNIEAFHRSQVLKEERVETVPGVSCWREARAIERVGLYVPGGSAPLFSTVLMLGVPAVLAGCSDIILCTPPDANGNVNPIILYCAKLLGIRKVFKVGGAQAIAALAYGTESIPAVSKIFGPGNSYVTKAKELVQEKGVAIDMPAGPSEVLVIADSTAVPEFVASDLLSQAEHGPDSQVLLLSDSNRVIAEVLEEIDRQLPTLKRRAIAEMALNASRVIQFENIEQCLQFSNYYAPEHLIIASENAEEYVPLVQNAGSVFLGNYSCESAGDYASGTNHTLPTNGFAKAYSGVSVDSFIKKITFQNISARGIKEIGPAIETMAKAELLDGHANAVTVRLKSLSNV
ncbi:histidinol dehydrogenase [Phaeocystidibacter luteus]|uniref:Histidinol dehydrogenase n=1 Tax=Phaeocystidibacter luteus TaxID=911197 RepID=A0A6N6RKM3_9FLAO|nr:histidinol dehydrogenase [Phaeocystidibacter luteus]KAB2807734.1 histidinol dehydrogenase [Phaeocystidibacter luteus]